MTQLDPPAGPDTVPATPPVQDPAPSAPQTAYDSEKFILLPKDQLGDYNGDWHEMSRLAGQGRVFESGGYEELGRRCGKDGTQILAELDAPEDDIPATPPPDTLTPDEQPLTKAGMQTMLEAQFAQRDKAAVDRRQREQTETAVAAAVTAQGAAATEALNALGITLDERGMPTDARGRAALSMFWNSLEDEAEKDVPPHLRGKARSDYLDQPATPAQLARASAGLKAGMDDLRNLFVAAHAEGTKDIPTETLSTGPGGGSAQKKPEDMSHEETVEFLTKGTGVNP